MARHQLYYDEEDKKAEYKYQTFAQSSELMQHTRDSSSDTDLRMVS